MQTTKKLPGLGSPCDPKCGKDMPNFQGLSFQGLHSAESRPLLHASTCIQKVACRWFEQWSGCCLGHRSQGSAEPGNERLAPSCAQACVFFTLMWEEGGPHSRSGTGLCSLLVSLPVALGKLPPGPGTASDWSRVMWKEMRREAESCHFQLQTGHSSPGTPLLTPGSPFVLSLNAT